ncbi:MAG: hypothetical protein M1817_001680 [Caeruleum heppii]|nr:MAG: hypothetical protein M1817_001680 [Caeruleum heppii]
MSTSAQTPTDPSKATTTNTTSSDPSQDPQKPAASLEEDDEFEDFPVDGAALTFLPRTVVVVCPRRLALTGRRSPIDWTQEDTEAAGEDNAHLWEESWDDDDTSEDFSAQLKEELKKVEANKR